ncbi:MAG: carboxylating nicotinate-nucleotide diphosphorylase [Rickettsiaceae bacterium]|nr:carboxylating nicotinate-nucleotide diphosphorylase [Rickettsiaceae bacterium]
MQLKCNIIRNLLDDSFKEDFGIKGDITSDSVIDKQAQIEFSINSRQKAVLCGIQIAKYYLDNYSTSKYTIHKFDSDSIKPGDALVSGQGNAREILLIERIILNYLQHLTGISTLTNEFVQKIKSTKAKILDTRKTTPMLRVLQKYAVSCGGGYNHRLALDSSIMIKDNHISICGSVTKAIQSAKKHNPHYAKIEIECDTIDQVKEAIIEGVDIILLDNMTIDQINKSLEIIDKRAKVEASGNVSLGTVEQIAKTGVDYISIGKITHSAPSADIGLDIK